MRVVAGIDEAGLGPILGPLTLGFAAFRTEHSARGLWDALRSCVRDDPAEDGSHLIVADSKRVFTRDPRGHARLESAVLAFLAQRCDAPRTPSCGRELIDCAPEGLALDLDVLARHPWYAHLPESLPSWCDVARLEAACGALGDALACGGAELVDCGIRTIPSGELNRSFLRTDSKGVTLWLAAAGLIEHLWRRFGAEELELWVDRQGGRIYYADVLQELFPMHLLTVVCEGAQRSEYRLQETGGARSMHLVLTPRAEDQAFPVALGSCVAKYAREVVMGAFNRFFGSHAAELRPTAGYLNDAWRWLADARPVLERLGMDRAVLVRAR